MSVNTRYRSEATEIMDDFNLEGAALEQALLSIARINRFLGGNKLTADGVEKIVREQPGKVYHITDMGCGNGDMLRALAELARKKNYQFSLTGIDANGFTIDNARSLSKDYPEISYHCADILDPDFETEPCDIILFTLTLHHFTNEEILSLLQKAKVIARSGIVINDLERSRLAYFLFALMSSVFRLNYINKTDGRLSILRGFKKPDLVALARKLNLKKYTIRWKWAFRYQWIITDL
jgi:SAM-dependent methyltransferase